MPHFERDEAEDNDKNHLCVGTYVSVHIDAFA